SFYLLYFLSKSLLLIKPEYTIQLLIAQQKVKHYESSLFMQAIPGFARTLYDENHKILCRTIEYQSLENLLYEFQKQDIEVIYNEHNHRMVRRFQAVDLHKESHANELLKEKGVYLLTGGMGGLGLIFARYLAKHYQAKLILTGRSIIDEKMT